MSFFSIDKDSISVRIYLSPGARQNRFNGLFKDADDRHYLKASVIAIPEDNKANHALIKILADELGIARTAIELVSGLQARKKSFRVHSHDPQVIKNLERLLGVANPG